MTNAKDRGRQRKVDERALSVHEAGHAVAHVRLDIDQAYVTIEAQGDYAAANRSAGPESVWDRDVAGSMVLAYCAGYAAMMASGYDEAASSAGCGDDYEKAGELITFWDLEGGLDEWRDRAVELMRRPENIAAVALVAAHLLQMMTLRSDTVDRLVELSDGVITQADFDQYITLTKSTGP